MNPAGRRLFFSTGALLLVVGCASQGAGTGQPATEAPATTDGADPTDATEAPDTTDSTVGTETNIDGTEVTDTTDATDATEDVDPTETTDPPEPVGLSVLGMGNHGLEGVSYEVLGTVSDGLNIPRDLAFNPSVPGQLWVANRGNESMVVYHDLGLPTQNAKKYWSLGSAHFFAQPSGIAWGAGNSFATIHETDKLTQGPGGTPPDFMGPTLQSADLFSFDAGHGSHLDMLHNSPLGMGIAYGGTGNLYWIFDGYHNAIVKYDFKSDHGKGGADHSDGEVARFVENQVARKANVPSHMELGPDGTSLYIADTGNNRIAVLDTTSGTKGSAIFPNYDQCTQYQVNGATLTQLVDGSEFNMSAPSGLAIHEERIFVADNANSVIYGFSMTGELLDWMLTDVPTGGLMGIEFDEDGNLVLVDATRNQIIRIRPLPDA